MLPEYQDLRGLSLWQLSASAIAFGAKQIETRSWRLAERNIPCRIAIRSSQTMGPGGLWALQKWMEKEENRDWLEYAGYREAKDLPLGAFVATATIASCVPTEELAPFMSDLEWSHGNFEPGRWAWTLEDVRRLRTPIPFSAGFMLGLFKISTEIQATILEQETHNDTELIALLDDQRALPGVMQRERAPRQFRR